MIKRQQVSIGAETLLIEVQKLLPFLGAGRVNSVAYDTAWVARLKKYYPENGFNSNLEWLRQHQHADGSWGADVPHHHDRFISTLAAIIALREVGYDAQDEARIRRGEEALWRHFAQLSQDDSDTVGFPVLSVALTAEANALGLHVPQPQVRYAAAYEKRVKALLNQTKRQWRTSPLAFSIEGLRVYIDEADDVLEANASVGISPAATAGLLISSRRPPVMAYLEKVVQTQADGGVPALSPIDTFEATWALSHLRLAGAVQPDQPEVRRILDFLWEMWCSGRGFSHSSYFSVPDLDDTAANFAILHWGGYPVSPDVFQQYEMDDHFCCYRGETNPSVSSQVRLLLALQMCKRHPRYEVWVRKVVNALRQQAEGQPYWSDKWHASPYYVNCAAVRALHGVADDLAQERVRWILATQNRDGGWGSYGASTPEETAYCLDTLIFADRTFQGVARSQITAAASYLSSTLDDETYTPLWIGKSLYTPFYVVKAAILAALYTYTTYGAR
jgi:halimadienyl-diphosphate synthase